MDDTLTLQRRVENAVKGDLSLELNSILDVEDTIYVPASFGLTVYGKSMHKTGVMWHGPPDRPVFCLREVRDSMFTNFSIETQTPLLGCFEVGRTTTAPGSINTTNNHRKRLWIQGNDITEYYVQHGGSRFDAGSYLNANNEANVDEDCHINNVKYGIKYFGNQCKMNVINRCRFNGGLHGVDAIYSTGSFTLFGGGGGQFQTFLHQADIADVIGIYHPDIEGCGRFLHTHGPGGPGTTTGAPMPILISGGRFMCDMLHADKKAILLQHGGDAKIHSMQLGLGAQPVPIISAEAPEVILDVSNMDFGSNGSSPLGCFIAATSNQHFDIGFNIYRDGSGNPYKQRGIPSLTEPKFADYPSPGFADYQKAR